MHPHRFKLLERVLSLDPQQHCQEIVLLVGAYEYPFLMQKSLEFALFRTYAVPSIGALLDQTQQFSHYAQRRYDDTSLLIAEIVENGYDSERGLTAIKQMNRLHGRYDISNDDFLYVLGAFIFTPIDWHERFGWRSPTHHEKLANYYFWVEVGKRMGMKALPSTYEAFEAFFRQYERDHFRYSDASHRVAEQTLTLFLGWYPRLLHPLIRQVIYAFLDAPLREAFGYPRANRAIQWLAERGLRAHAWWLRHVASPRKTPHLLTKLPNRTYPNGYTIETMGLHDTP